MALAIHKEKCCGYLLAQATPKNDNDSVFNKNLKTSTTSDGSQVEREISKAKPSANLSIQMDKVHSNDN